MSAVAAWATGRIAAIFSKVRGSGSMACMFAAAIALHANAAFVFRADGVLIGL
jgi:hypothetical protein